MEIENTNHMEFWTYKLYKEKYGLGIDIPKFLDFLGSQGFGNFEVGLESYLVRIENNVIKKIKDRHINMFAKDYINSLPEQLEHEFTKKDLLVVFHNRLCTLVQRNQLSTLPKITPSYKKDKADRSFKFFKNCFVEITKDKIITHDYKNLDGVIWESQIINHNFKIMEVKDWGKDNEFYKFLWNCMGKDEQRLTSIISIIGYLIHTYKNPTNAKAIIFCDEKVSENPNGGSGKSLTAKAIAMFLKTAIEDGKVFNSTGNFAFQQVTFDTMLVWIDDVLRNFNLESLFSSITGGMIIEKKHQDKIYIPSEESPKFLITTNYTVQGIGTSFERRKIELEFSSHYNETITPDVEFGHRFFDDWEDEQWSKFYNFMLYCIQFTISKGMVVPPKININIKKAIQATNKELVEFADAITRNVELNKATVFADFKRQYKDFENMRQRTFTDWLKIYSDYAEDIYRMDERKSNSDRFFTFLSKPKPFINYVQGSGA